MSDKSIIIIGAGIAGLSAGCYCQMNGYRTKIYEMHDKPGGLCTSWKRKDYTIDGCIHWMNGTGRGTNMNKLWLELGALQDKKIVNHDEFCRIIGDGGKHYILYTNIDQYIRHLKELAPEDSDLIEELGKDLHKISKIDMPVGKPAELSNFIDKMKMFFDMLPNLGLFKKYMVGIQEYADRFKNPFLRDVFAAPFEMGGEDFPMFGLVFTLADMHIKNAGYPIGGSLELARSIEQRYLDLGGSIQYKARVEKILVENDRAAGVRLADGSEHRADIVISAADGHSTIFDMLQEKYIDDEIRGYYQNMPIFEPFIQVSLGVKRDLHDAPHMAIKKLQEPLDIAGEKRKYLGFSHYAYDPTLAPEGKTVVICNISSNHAYWKNLLEEDRERYEAEKKDIALKVISQLELLYPGISQDIEVTDVATPLTYERYTGNWQGTYEGWLITQDTMKMMQTGESLKDTLPGLENFYMVGQWVQPGGGLPSGLETGRNVAQILCHKDRKTFTTSEPSG